MVFHSIDFLVFFAIAVAIYWRLPHRAQNVFLLGASYLFYGWVHPWFVLLMLTSTTVDFWAAQRMEDDPGRKRFYLWASLAVNLGMLGFFKYFNFFVDNVRDVLAVFGLTVAPPLLQIVLPAGISFYTFQALSYTVDVYRGEMHARRNPIDFALFVAFFPHLVAGPIMRARNLLVQVEQPRRFSVDAARHAVVLAAWGFFKKLVIADNVGIIANRVFAHQHPTFEILWAGVFAFGIQIYADFSAYSDIARAVARWFGFSLVLNFDHPYIAASPIDFWRRWHISLSTWFRDYVYVPLGGNRVPALQREVNVLATFLISGLWHGASWNYVLWGFYHGVLVVATRAASRLTRSDRRAAIVSADGAGWWPRRLAQIAVTLPLMMAGWLLFRETDPVYLLRHLQMSPFASTPGDRAIGIYLFVMAATWALPLVVDDALALVRERRGRVARWLAAGDEAPGFAGAQLATASVLVTLTLVLRSQVSLDFIYFQF